MKLEHVEIDYSAVDHILLSKLRQDLSKLDLTFRADLEGLDGEIRSDLGNGKVSIIYGTGEVSEGVRGKLVILNLLPAGNYTPEVMVTGLENLSGFEISYRNRSLDIIRRAVDPIRYVISN